MCGASATSWGSTIAPLSPQPLVRLLVLECLPDRDRGDRAAAAGGDVRRVSPQYIRQVVPFERKAAGRHRVSDAAVERACSIRRDLVWQLFGYRAHPRPFPWERLQNGT